MEEGLFGGRKVGAWVATCRGCGCGSRGCKEDRGSAGIKEAGVENAGACGAWEKLGICSGGRGGAMRGQNKKPVEDISTGADGANPFQAREIEGRGKAGISSGRREVGVCFRFQSRIQRGLQKPGSGPKKNGPGRGSQKEWLEAHGIAQERGYGGRNHARHGVLGQSRAFDPIAETQ